MHHQGSELHFRVQPRRRLEGIAAVLLPFDAAGEPDFASLAQHLAFTAAAGLIPAVNMDTGYVHLLNTEQRCSVLEVARSVLDGGPFVAGAFIEGESGEPTALYAREVEAIQSHGGTPILFQCSALKGLSRADLIGLYRTVASGCERLLAFELGEMFAPFGQIYDLETVAELMQIPQIAGMKHSSLSRRLEWQRLALRDRLRPEFKLYTGNDLAIDMVMYGSDYLLGLATFAPDAFALRDRLWAAGDPAFYELNDLLQYLGSFTFRPPVPAYRHNAAQFLKLRGLIGSDQPHPRAPRRPDSDLPVLADIAGRLEAWLQAA
jgi:dihydrodipicolinate synthase/N-acetylneuraminate lyase